MATEKEDWLRRKISFERTFSNKNTGFSKTIDFEQKIGENVAFYHPFA